MHEPDTNDIVILDKNLGFVNKFTGAQKCRFRKEIRLLTPLPSSNEFKEPSPHIRR